MRKKKYYAVMRLSSCIIVNGVESKLPKGEYFMPAFCSRKKAIEYSENGKYKIMIGQETEKI